MSISMSLLSILHGGPSFGLQLRNEFEARTGGVWPLNVGQVYTTIDRLERDGLIRQRSAAGAEAQKVYEITSTGRRRVAEWFGRPSMQKTPSRDELVLKLIMAAAHDPALTGRVVQEERRAAMELLQDYTRLKRDAPSEADLGWLILIDSLIFQTEARLQWLDACEARLLRGRPQRPPRKQQRRRAGVEAR